MLELGTRLKALMKPTWQVSPQIERTLAEVPMTARICDLGAGGRRVRPDVFAVDVLASPGVDLVCDIHELPIESSSFDVVICTGTLNLCHDPKRVLSEVARILRPGGLFHLEVGMFQPYNPEPEDYWRFTLPGLKRINEEAGLTPVRTGAHMGPFAALTNNMLYLVSAIADGPSLPNRAVRAAAHVSLGGIKYFDGLLSEEVMERAPFAYGIYCVSQKAKT